MADGLGELAVAQVAEQRAEHVFRDGLVRDADDARHDCLARVHNHLTITLTFLLTLAYRLVEALYLANEFAQLRVLEHQALQVKVNKCIEERVAG